MKHMQHKQLPKPFTEQGFSLVELSIVLVLVGLLIGAVLVGRDVMEGAERRKLIAEMQAIDVAMQEFRGTYLGWPGDLVNASDFWGAGCGGASAVPAGCNGNGNNRIQGWTGEPYKAWKHLELAGLIQGGYTGLPVGSVIGGMIGVNMPRSAARDDVALYLDGEPNAVGGSPMRNNNAYAPEDNNYLLFGAQRDNDFPNIVAFTPEDAMLVDEKADDGLPGVGRIRADHGVSHSNCYTDPNPSEAVFGDETYNPAVNSKQCVLVYVFDRN